MNAPEAAVARVQKALGCVRSINLGLGTPCAIHLTEWTDRGCPVAVAAADAAVAPIAAQTLRDAADIAFNPSAALWLRYRAADLEADHA